MPPRQCPACDAAPSERDAHYADCPLKDVPLAQVAGLSLRDARAKAAEWRSRNA
ncbi:hypothetical protein J7W19_13620 [Streptomyces mobaraensis NBRC 13819 = DSM 40847]|uniref:hypothetical protein n=1 Tax=Streptomyces mobaraensis TaxID=35621 RepID=UPI000346F564|nr:hypothetical protein [Streptomyces mobaraensis]QTT74303.1 hypothetical protein J7W19_13620 [Streptomyces mobaraensis NBRC 13819 = DSM 40847]